MLLCSPDICDVVSSSTLCILLYPPYSYTTSAYPVGGTTVCHTSVPPSKSPKHALFSISNVGVSFILKSIQNQFSRTEIISSKQQNHTRLVRAKALAGGVVIISPLPSLVSGSASSCARALPPSRRCRLLRQPAPSLSPSPPSSGATSPPASKYPPLLRLLAPANKLPLLLHKLNPQIQT